MLPGQELALAYGPAEADPYKSGGFCCSHTNFWPLFMQMSSKRGYRLLREESVGAGGEEDEETSPPSRTEGTSTRAGDVENQVKQAAAVDDARPSFRIRILDTTGREHNIDLESSTVTIGALKAKIAEVADVPASLQRLIFCGKMLTDAQTLEAAGVKANNCVHLFARPAHAQMPGSSTSPTGSQPGRSAAGQSSLAGPTTHLTGSSALPHHHPSLALYTDPELMRSVQSVKLFSSCLVAICTMQLLLLLLRLLNSWQDESDAGASPSTDDPVPVPPHTDQDDSTLFFLQVMLNSLGIYVGLMGARSAHTLQPQAARAYFVGLCVVGTLWIALRVIWAIRTVAAGYDTEVGPPPKPAAGGGGDGGGGGVPGDGGSGDGADNGTDVPRSELIYMVTLSVMVYVGLWSICWLRASQFSRRLNATLPQRNIGLT